MKNVSYVEYKQSLARGCHCQHGWTAEPKSRYYDFRGWDKNIFEEEERDKKT